MGLYYKESGETNPSLMVFIHGGGVSGWMWDKQVEYFSTKYHCLVPDMPEQGKSKNEIPFTIKAAADEIIQLIEELRKDKPIIAIGFSLGAQVLIELLSKKPNLIEFAMINSALVKPINFNKTLTKSMVFAFPLVRNKTFSKIQARSMYLDEEYQYKYYQESCQMNKDAFLRMMNENMTFTIPTNFERVSSKILVTVGEKEKKIMRDSMNEIVKSNTNCQGKIIPHIGHGFSLANPNLFNTMLEEWIENNET